MIKPRCHICNKDLLGGYQEIIYTKVDASDIPQEQKDELKKLPEQISYWAHNPRFLHEDILVTAHRDCFDKVKAIYPVFDQPVQDYDICRYKVIEKEKVVEKTPKEFILMNNLAYIQTLTELISKTKEEMKVAKDFELPEKQKTITQLEVKIAEIKLENKNLVK